MDIETSIFLQKYEDEMVENLKRIRPNISEDKIRKKVRKEMEKTLSNQEETMVTLFNNYTQEEEEISLLDMIDFYLKPTNKPIISGNGTFFLQHDKSVNLNSLFVDWLMKERQVYKDIQFEGADTNDALKEIFGMMMQKTMKILNNSYYGATGEKSSIFYNDNIGPAITYTGYQIITSSILGFEMLLSDNVKFDNISDMLIYINNILNDRSDVNILEVVDRPITKKECYRKIKSRFSKKFTKEELQPIKRVVQNLSDDELTKIYYTNNFYEFFENSLPKSLLGMMVNANYKIHDPKDIDDECKGIIEELWDLMKKYIVYDHQIFNRAKRCLTMNRETIITVDTDSNFLSLERWYNFCKNNYDIEIDESSFEQEEINDDEYKMFTIINTAVLLLSKYVQSVLDRLTGNANLKEEKQPIINMKSEFFYPRIMLTRNKKQYVGLLRIQEGHVIFKKNKQIDMKGMSIKKATVNPRTKEYFTKIIEDDILRSEDIDIARIFGKYIEFEREIRESLEKGETTFLTPVKVNDFFSYATPERQQQIRGAYVWNELYPDESIQTPDKGNMLKVLGSEISELKDIYGTEEFQVLQDVVFTVPDKKDTSKIDISKYGFTAITLPKSVDKIPEWLIPIINYKAIIEDNLRTGNLILQSIGMNLMTFRGKETYSPYLSDTYIEF